MKHLIDKSVVITKIENLKNDAKIYPSDFYCGRLSICNELMNFLDTLEVKEVDLEEEVDNYVNEYFSECDDGVLISDANSMELTLLDITPLAKHFFELGIKAQKGDQR